MSEIVKVKDNPNLIRDLNTNAILNTDNNALKQYKKSRKYVLQQKCEYDKMKEEVDCLRNEIIEMKQLLVSLVKE